MNTFLLKRACRTSLVWSAIAAAQARADAPPIEVKTMVRSTPVSFSREVQPFLEDRCVGCHGSAGAKSRLNMETVAGMLKGGKRGPAIRVGRGDDSLIVKTAARRAAPAMPPVDKPANQPLKPDQLGLLKLWIDQGARDDSPETSEEAAAALELHEPPAEIRAINAVDLTADGARVAAGRSNKVQILDVDSGLEITTLDGGKDLVQSLRYSPDASVLAVGGYQTVALWSAPRGGPRTRHKAHAGAVAAVAQAGGMLYSAGLDKTIRAWKTGASEPVQTWPQPSIARTLAVAPDGKSLFAGRDDGAIHRLETAKGTETAVLKGHTKAVVDLVVLASTKDLVRLASASSDGTARIWTIASEPGKADAVRSSPFGGGKAIRAIASVHKGKLVAAAGEDGGVSLYHGETGALVKTIPSGRDRPIRALAASDRGLLLAGYDDGAARLITLSEGKLVHDLTGHRGTVGSVAFSPDGDRLATADDAGGVKIWETDSGAGVIAFGHNSAPNGKPPAIDRVSFTDRDEFVTAAADGALTRWWFSGTWSLIRTLGPHRFRVLALDFSPDGKMLAAGGGEPSASGEVLIWEVGKGLLGRKLESLHSDTVLSLRFSPDGTKLATAGADKFLKVVTLADGKTARSFEGHTHHVMGVDWEPGGKRIVSAGADGVLKVWDYESGDQIRTLKGPKKAVTAVRWLAVQGEIVASSGDGLTRAWNPDNPAPKRTFGGPGDYILCLSASTNGARLASGRSDGTLHVWDAKTGLDRMNGK